MVGPRFCAYMTPEDFFPLSGVFGILGAGEFSAPESGLQIKGTSGGRQNG